MSRLVWLASNVNLQAPIVQYESEEQQAVLEREHDTTAQPS
jgi:hypothetical protein